MSLLDLRWPALAFAAAQLCGCIFLFEEASSESGAGGTGATSTTATGGAGGGGAQGGAGGEGGQGGGGEECNFDNLNCGLSGKNCEGGTCACGVCQGFEVLDGMGDGLVNGPIGFGGSTLAYVSAPRVCFLAEASTTPKCVSAATSTDAFGTHLAVSSIGEAFYSSQNASGAYPVQRCRRDIADCAPIPATTTIQAGHLNGLTIASLAGTEQLLGVDSGTGILWRLKVTGDLSLTQELGFVADGMPAPVLHDLAQRENLFVASNQESPPAWPR